MMLMPASAEFIALCQSQIALMAQGVGADSAAVYLAESWSEQAAPKLVPIALYPPLAASSQSQPERTSDKILPGSVLSASSAQPSQPSGKDSPRSLQGVDSPAASKSGGMPALWRSDAVSQSSPATTQQLAIPLVHDGGMMGVLVSWRDDRPWQPEERHQMEACAHTLALACVLDQRGQWLQTQVSALNRLQDNQSDRFHELLHQLRNPLTALKTFGKLLTKRLAPEDKNQALVVNMLRESDRMQELLGYFDDTLQAADQTRTETAQGIPLLAPSSDGDDAVEAAAFPVTADSLSHFGGTLQVHPSSVATLVSPLVDSMATLAEAAGMTLHVFPPEQESWVQTDSHALVEILSNFLENALKYSPVGTHLWIQWGLMDERYPDRVGILVGDTGPGIPKADQPHIFERHYRGVQAVGAINGSGLGLAIAADLVQEMDGQIEVYSPLSEMPWPLPPPLQAQPTRKGTAFVVWLPEADMP